MYLAPGHETGRVHSVSDSGLNPETNGRDHQPVIEGGGSGGVLWAAVTAVAVGVATPAPAVVSGVGDGDHPKLSHIGNVNENCV